eukprot:1640016-Pyramimonas_sp.AAC.1
MSAARRCICRSPHTKQRHSGRSKPSRIATRCGARDSLGAELLHLPIATQTDGSTARQEASRNG